MCLSATVQRDQNVEVLSVLRFGDSFVARMISGSVFVALSPNFIRLIQTTKHKYRFHVHISKFLVTAASEPETKTARRSA